MLEQVLNTYVRPLLQSHGGDMEVISYEDGILRFRMKGSCAGCAAADLTTENLINEELRSHLEGFREAVLVNTVSNELLVQARAILGKKKADQSAGHSGT